MDAATQKVIDFIVPLAQKWLHPNTIMLFGSRARGDAQQISDFDIAFDFDTHQYQKNWGRFCTEIQENAPTLLPIDCINTAEISDIFLAKIHMEGIIIYQKGE